MPVSLQIRIDGLDEARRKIGNLSDEKRLFRGTVFFVKKRLEEGVDIISREAPKGPTRDLSNQIELVTSESGGTLEAEYILASKHTRFVVEGTGIFGPHRMPIRPRTAQFLQFFKEDKWIRAKQVRGQPPNEFLARSAQIIRRRVITTVPIEFRRLINVTIAGVE